MKNTIKNKTPIVVELRPNRDVTYSGICLKESHEVFILIGLNEDTLEYDGIIIIRSHEIEEYRYLESDESSNITIKDYEEIINSLTLNRMNTFYECLDFLKKKDLIAIYTEDDDESYYIGKIINLSNKSVTIELISKDGKWLKPEEITIKDITYLGFDSSYEKELMKKIYD